MGTIEGYTLILYHTESVGSPNINIDRKRCNKSNPANAASWVLKQFRIRFDVKITIAMVFAKNRGCKKNLIDINKNKIWWIIAA